MANETFVSSTMWTERIGFVAANKTIEILCRDKVWEHLIEMGDLIGSSWVKSANKFGLKLQINEFKPLISFRLGYEKYNNLILTIFMQEMLKRGYLASSSIYLSKAHNEKVIKKYLFNVEKVFEIIARAIDKNKLEKTLKTDVRSDAFQRLT